MTRRGSTGAASRLLTLVAASIVMLGGAEAHAQKSNNRLPLRTPSRKADIPMITKPVMFNTPEADRIVSGLQIFPANNPWNEDISSRPVHPHSKAIIATMEPRRSLGYNFDMGYIIVPAGQKKVPVGVQYAGESDPGPYPISDNAPIEGWPLCCGGQKLDQLQRAGEGDRHVMVLDPYAMKLYELFAAYKTDRGWSASQASVFDLTSNKMRPDGWTSADAAGLPIFPAAVRYADVQKGIVAHAMRFTVIRTRKAYVYPATHQASPHTDENYPRMGERFRLRKDFDVSGFSPHAQAILKGLKVYGMFVADNGMNWLISVTPDDRIKGLDDLRRVRGSDFEVIVPTGPAEGPRAR